MLFLKISFHARRSLLLNSALVAAIFTTSNGLLLNAETPATGSPGNLGTEKNGAFVSYSSPLKGGATGEALVNGQPNTKLSFSKAGGTHIIVIDLSKPSKLNTVQLKFSHPANVNVFVLKKKPEGNNWNQALEGLKPDAVLDVSGASTPLNGAEGEFLVLVYPNDPGAFSDLVVTGFHLDSREHHFANNDHFGHPLGEVPLPESEYENHNHPPHVPPTSH